MACSCFGIVEVRSRRDDHRDYEPELEALIRQRMQAGAFENPEDLIREALHPSSLDTRTGMSLIEAMQSCPYPEVDIEPSPNCASPKLNSAFLRSSLPRRFRNSMSALSVWRRFATESNSARMHKSARHCMRTREKGDILDIHPALTNAVKERGN